MISFRHSPIDPSTGKLRPGLGLGAAARTTGACTSSTPKEEKNESDDTNIYVRYSDDNGMTWSNGVRVNDDNTTNSQFMPKISLDQTTGQIAVVWYDSRNDLGTGGTGDTDGVPEYRRAILGRVQQRRHPLHAQLPDQRRAPELA